MNLKQWIGLGMAAAAVAVLGGCPAGPAVSPKEAEVGGPGADGAAAVIEFGPGAEEPGAVHAGVLADAAQQAAAIGARTPGHGGCGCVKIPET